MNAEHFGLIGAIASGVLLLATAHPVWFLTLIACSCCYGWTLGQRLFPADEYGA